MPELIFGALDATQTAFSVNAVGVVVTQDGPDAPISTPLSSSIINVAVGSWELSVNISATDPGIDDIALCNIECFDSPNPAVIQEFIVDYDRLVLPVPDNAQVKKLTYRRPLTINIQLEATGFDNPFNTYAEFIEKEFDFLNPLFPGIPSSSGNDYISPRVLNESIIGPAADEVLFDLTAGPTFVTKAELISLWSEFENNLGSIQLLSQGRSNGIGSGTSDIAGSMVVGLNWQVRVEYEETFTWNVSQSTVPNVNEGSEVTLTSSEEIGETPLDMEQITQIDIVFPDPDNPGDFITIPVITFEAINTFLLTFIVPSFGVYTPTYFSVVITTTQFSGTLDLGRLTTIFFLSASGLYTLEFGKTNDTLYLEDELPDTINVKIPDPFIKTGYVDG